MPEASAVICCPVTLPLGVSILFSKSHSGHIPSKWNIRRVAKCFHPSPSCDLYLREINAQNWELLISLNSFKVDIVRVESSERWAACVSRSPAQFSHFRWLWTTRRCLWHYNMLHISTYFICQVEVLEGFQEQVGDSRQLTTDSHVFPWKLLFLAFSQQW